MGNHQKTPSSCSDSDMFSKLSIRIKIVSVVCLLLLALVTGTDAKGAGGTLSYVNQELSLTRAGKPDAALFNLDFSPIVSSSKRSVEYSTMTSRPPSARS